MDLERGNTEKAVGWLDKIIKHLEREISKNRRDEGRMRKNHGNVKSRGYPVREVKKIVWQHA